MKTKKITNVLLITGLFLSLVNPTSVKGGGAYEEGQNTLSAGYGFGTVMGSILNAYTSQTGYSSSTTGPIYLKFEHAMTDKISLGLNIAYASWKLSYRYTDPFFGSGGFVENDTYTTYSILARLNWHFGDIEKFDPYFGFGLGYRSGTWSYTSTNPNGNDNLDIGSFFPFGFETTIGARYYFSDKFGAYMELGAAKSVFQVGLTAKF